MFILSLILKDSDCDDNHQCSNGYCVSPDYNCSEELNICGEEDSNCDISEDEAQTNFFSEVFRYGFVIVVVVVFGCFLKGFCKSFKPCEKIRSCRSNYSGHCPDRLGNCMSSVKEVLLFRHFQNKLKVRSKILLKATARLEN